MSEKRAITLGAMLSGLVPLIVYALTVQRTVPFWDSGEFIATSHILGIPHPPGTPFYVLIGRVWSLLPFSTAIDVNFLSSLSSVAAVVFTFLMTSKFISYWFYGAPGDPRRATPPAGAPATIETAIQIAGGLVAAFFIAFSFSFWNNAVEAEVYAMASGIMNLTAWMTLVWWERHREPGSDNILLAILYILSVSIGIHLGCFLVAPALFLFVLMVDWRRLLSGRELAAALILIGAVVLFLITQSLDSNLETSLAISMVAAALALAVKWKKLVRRNLVAWFGILFVLGVSVHFYLLIRSHLRPGINEADPSTWKNLWLVLTRDQYKPGSPFERRAAWWYQINHMFLRYLAQQFVLGDWLGFVGRFVPLFLGMLGALSHWMREKKGFFYLFMLFFWTAPFLIFYLNFKEGEVRERDYFFVMGFNFFAIWIGMGVADLALRLRDAARSVRIAVPGFLAAGLIVSLLPLTHEYFVHDRSKNWVAHGYGRNMLVGLPKDSILFTNGDNDTFPLWYMQQVENFRKDVRIVNLSLLNTDWYIRQLRDDDPKVPIAWDNAQIVGEKPIKLMPGMTEPYAVPQRERTSGQVLLLKDIAVKHIIEQNAWKLPVYIAVTVPDQMGLEKQLEMEGLVFRIHPEPPPDLVNEPVALEMLDHQYEYKGLLDKDGFYDLSVYKDDNESRLTQNYAAARVRLAYQYAKASKIPQALEQMEKAAMISADFPGVLDYLGGLYREAGDLPRGERFVRQLMQHEGTTPTLMRYLGDMQAEAGHLDDAVKTYQQAIQADPDLRDGYWNLFLTLWQAGKKREGITVLDQWLKRRPDDDEVRRYRDAFFDSLSKQG